MMMMLPHQCGKYKAPRWRKKVFIIIVVVVIILNIPFPYGSR